MQLFRLYIDQHFYCDNQNRIGLKKDEIHELILHFYFLQKLLFTIRMIITLIIT